MKLAIYKCDGCGEDGFYLSQLCKFCTYCQNCHDAEGNCLDQSEILEYDPLSCLSFSSGITFEEWGDCPCSDNETDAK